MVLLPSCRTRYVDIVWMLLLAPYNRTAIDTEIGPRLFWQLLLHLGCPSLQTVSKDVAKDLDISRFCFEV